MKTEYVIIVDELGRILLPDEIIHTFHWSKGTKITIALKGRRLILKTYKGRCSLCHNEKHIKVIWGKPICRECIEKLNRIF